jgi:ATP-dependent Clp protease, protease subunit
VTVQVNGTIPGPLGPDRPGPGRPGYPSAPGQPGWPGPPGGPGQPAVPPAEPGGPVRVWLDPGQWSARIYERLYEQRIVMAQGHLDDEAATRLCAQVLTLDAESAEPIRLELQGLDAELPAALTAMGVLETLRAPVLACVAGRLSGPALGILAACGQRRGYPNAVLELAEARLSYSGSVTALSSQEEQARAMADALWEQIALATGREVDDIRADARQGRFLTVDEAIAYGLLTERAARP